MKNLTYYSAGRKNFAVWLSVALTIFAIGARIWYFSFVLGGTVFDFTRIVLPIVANLCYVALLLLKGEKQLYVVRGPIILTEIYFLFSIWGLGIPKFMALAVSAYIVARIIFASILFTYRSVSKLPYLVSFFFFGFACLDPEFVPLFSWIAESALWFMIPDIAMALSLLVLVIGMKKLPPLKDGEYRLKPGDREDGRLVRTREVMGNLNGFFLVRRSESTNYFQTSVEIANLEKYVHQKRREGYKHFGLMHVLIAAYVRTVAEYPGLNRFFAGQRTFVRDKIIVNMIVKKEMAINKDDSMVKVYLDPADTAAEVYEKYNAVLETVKDENNSTGFDNIMKYINKIPRLVLKFCVWLIKLLDYFGIIPASVLDLSPFHGSMFITSMGSLGIPPIYHHLYDFGNLPVFIAFGAKRAVAEFNQDGEVVKKKYIDFTIATDERIIDGFYYAQAQKKMMSYLLHPERLDEKPEEIVPDID